MNTNSVSSGLDIVGLGQVSVSTASGQGPMTRTYEDVGVVLPLHRGVRVANLELASQILHLSLAVC